MLASSGAAAQFQKPGLSPDSTSRWSAIANRLIAAGNQPNETANLANQMTREAIGKRLNIVRDNSYIQPPPVGMR